LYFAAGLSPALAESFRCGSYIISEGMRASEVVQKCGEPQHRETVEAPVMARGANGAAFQVGTTTTEYWTYDFGPRMFPAYLTIQEGQTKKIELLSRR
jgi:hypothetical protein